MRSFLFCLCFARKESLEPNFTAHVRTQIAYIQGVPTKDAEGQALALGFTRAKRVQEHVGSSLQ